MNDHQFGKALFNRFTVRVFRECLSICVCSLFPFVFEDEMWDLIVLILYFAFSVNQAHKHNLQ